MATKKYINLSNLSTFLSGLRITFAELTHTHTISEISDFEIDAQLSPTSTNPVQNKVVNTEFEAISQAMNALEFSIDGKSDVDHTHAMENFIMTDTVTGATYHLCVTNGHLVLALNGEGVITGYEDGDGVTY